jgi:capsular polysaccharide biosynthesis protein
MKIDSAEVDAWRAQADWHCNVSQPSSYLRTPPNLYNFRSSSSDLKRFILNEVNRPSVETWPIDIYVLNEAYATDLCAVFDKDKLVFPPSLADLNLPSDFDWYEKFSDNGVPYLDEEAVFIFKAGKENYGHFIVEMLPKLDIVANQIDGIVNIIVPTVPDKIKNGLFDVVNLLYPGKFKYFFLSSPVLKVKKLIYPGPIAKHNNEKTHAVSVFAGKITNQVANRNTGRALPVAKKIYVSRGDESKRGVVNGFEIECFFSSLGFSIFRPEFYTFLEQAEVFRNARVVAGPLGAGLTNTIYAPEGSKIILLDPGMYDFFFYDLACLKGQDFHWVFDDLKFNDDSTLTRKISFNLKNIFPLLSGDNFEI